MINEQRLIDLFLNLCLIDAPALQEADSVKFMRRHLESIGKLEVWEDKAGPKIGGNANNLIARLRGNKPGAPSVYLSAHFDTVEPTAGLTIDEYNGIFYSTSDTILGADDKAGMAPAVEAVRCLIESDEEYGDVYLLFSCAEEIGLKGAGVLDIEDLNIDFGYVLDTGPPVGSFVTRTANHDKIDFTVIGKPAHAGKDPENGINAVQVAAAAINGMKLGRIGPETTANIGIIQGGTGVNVVCPKVLVKAEARSTSIEELDAQIAHMRGKFEEAAAEWGAELIVNYERHYLSYDIPENSRVVEVAQRAAKSMGFDGNLRTTLGGSDANIYNKKGVPSIVVATGMTHIHTHDEFVSRKDLIDTAELAYRLLVEAAK